jgi:hypothetical protein
VPKVTKTKWTALSFVKEENDFSGRINVRWVIQEVIGTRMTRIERVKADLFPEP